MEIRLSDIEPGHTSEPAPDEITSIELLAAKIRTCKKCGLHSVRKRAVPGEGPLAATYMFVGEGPGFHEDDTGKPFVGRSGNLLDDLLLEAGLDRREVFITNIVKCRPPGNRDPSKDEISECSPYLRQQIELVDPRVIVTLGRFSMAQWFPDDKISKIHGKAQWFRGRIVVPMYHPAAALHRPGLKNVIKADFALLPKFLDGKANIRPEKTELETAEQMTLI